jgi:N-methylhydantoinase A
MPAISGEQNALRIGVDVGGTFTDLVCFDPQSGRVDVVKLPSTPPDFHKAVIEAVGRVRLGNRRADIVHGSTVATNALLQRAGEPCAFVTTEGFRDMLLIGRQNRPDLYALHVVRPRPLTGEENWFTVRERIGAGGEVIVPLDAAEVDGLVGRIRAAGLRHVAVCLLFSFLEPGHERMIGRACEAAGLTVSLSCDVLPEFREYERASTTVINASLRPTVEKYLGELSAGLMALPPLTSGGDWGEGGLRESSGGGEHFDNLPHPALSRGERGKTRLRIMHSGGGTLSVEDARESAAKLVLSGPAGGLIGAAHVALAAGFGNVITYDMGGTSTDVATVIDGRPQWTTSSSVDGLPLGLATLDIHTVGAGGGSIAFLDAGGALRVGPRSAGAIPGPACYRRGGEAPTVTDANLVLGRIMPDRFAGGAMRVDPELARRAIAPLAEEMEKTVIEAALGIVRVAENNMARAIRAVSSRRGLDPRKFTLLSFGGAGGLHACALAESLEIPRVLAPPYCGVLSALGMVVAPPVADASKTVVHLGEQLDDARLAAEFGGISGRTMDVIPYEQTAAVEAYADVRFAGQSHELSVRVNRPSWEHITERFHEAYRERYGQVPAGRRVEIVTLRARRTGKAAEFKLPRLEPSDGPSSTCEIAGADGEIHRGTLLTRQVVFKVETIRGPLLIVDPEATVYVPPEWLARVTPNGSIVLWRQGGNAHV